MKLERAALGVARRLARRDFDDDLPPGPPLCGWFQLYRWITDPVGFFEGECSGYGEAFTIRLPTFADILVLTDPDAIREVFTGSGDDLHAGEANRALEPFMGPHSVLLLDGPEHLEQRRLLLPPFHGRRMRAYGELMCEVAERTFASVPIGRPFPIHEAMQDLTLEVILRAVFGVEEPRELAELSALLKRLLDRAANPFFLLPIVQRDYGPGSPWRRFANDMEATNALLYRLIARRRAKGASGRSDVLSVLLEARHEDGSAMSDEELRDELMTMLVAGHETSATTLAWCVYRLLQHPEAARRMRAEVDENVDDRVTPAAVATMPYLEAFVKETLRLNPIIPLVGRRLQRPMRIAGLHLPKGMVVSPCIYLTHRNPRLWENPTHFEPERFLEGRVSPHQFFPFGGGIRRCIGMAFAMYEIRNALAVLVHRMDLSRAPGDRIRLVRRSITFAPSRGMPVIARPRRGGAARGRSRPSAPPRI